MLHIYACDVDNNLLYTPEVIYAERVGGVRVGEQVVYTNTADFFTAVDSGEVVPPDGKMDNAFVDYTDHGSMGENAFGNALCETYNAGKYALYRERFIEILQQRQPFALVTFRRHSAESLHRGLLQLGDLLAKDDVVEVREEYLRSQVYLPVNNRDCLIELGLDPMHETSSAYNSLKKYKALCFYIEHIRSSHANEQITLHYSDDHRWVLDGIEELYCAEEKNAIWDGVALQLVWTGGENIEEWEVVIY